MTVPFAGIKKTYEEARPAFQATAGKKVRHRGSLILPRVARHGDGGGGCIGKNPEQIPSFGASRTRDPGKSSKTFSNLVAAAGAKPRQNAPSLGAIWGQTRCFMRFDRFERFCFVRNSANKARFEMPVKFDSRRLHHHFRPDFIDLDESGLFCVPITYQLRGRMGQCP
jgi:hypothetical protein